MARCARLAAVALLMASPACGGDSGGDGDAGGPADAARIDAGADPTGFDCNFPRRELQPIEVEAVWPELDLTAPVALRPHPDGQRFYVGDLTGQIRLFTAGPEATATTVLDISDRVNLAGESGLTGFALHPDFPATPEIYVAYTGRPPCPGVGCPASILRLSRFTSTDGGLTAPAASEEILLEAESRDPRLWHQNADVAFGPDGLLYVGFGDGGAPLDAYGHSQDPSSLLGKVLRIDVSTTPYGIPPGNPFAQGGGAPEVFALGLRSPWRMSFDAETGDLWLGDVGEDTREELDLIVAGGNYGWPHLEGTRCLTPPCEGQGFIAPVREYDHGYAGGRSVVAGYVYRGSALPSLAGRHVHADFVSGRIWATDGDGTTELVHSYPGAIVAFGQGLDGELYVLDLFQGRISRLIPGGLDRDDAPAFPTRLSETGCMVDGDPTTVSPDKAAPYAINVPFWSDGVDKRRWLRVPSGRATVGAEGHIDLPVGGMLIKEFLWQDELIETRFLVHHEDGWGFYSYLWDPGGTDATLIHATSPPIERVLDGLTWTYPDRSGCLGCHGDSAGVSLGPSIAQLNREVGGAGGTVNQLAYLADLGLLEEVAAPGTLPRFPELDDATAPVEDRARAWLHANCAHCHRPSGGATVDLDLRATVPFADAGLCDVAPQNPMGVAGARLIAPGDPSRSVILQRMASLDPELRMPPLFSQVVDEDAEQLLREWIAGLTICP